MTMPRFVSTVVTAATLFLLSIGANAEQPEWAKHDTLKLVDKNTLELACQSVGPSLEDARSRAFLSCDSTAIQYLQRVLNFKSLTVETESDAMVHSEAVSAGSVQDLKCLPLNEAIEQREAQFEVWLKCRYRLDQAKVTSTGQKEESSLAVDALKQKPYRISVTSVPPCASILVEGKLTKKFRCSSGPTTFTATAQDKRFIVRANGKKPKVIPLPLGDSSSPGETKFLDVIFEEE